MGVLKFSVLRLINLDSAASSRRRISRSSPNTPPIIKVDFKIIGVYTKNIYDIER